MPCLSGHYFEFFILFFVFSHRFNSPLLCFIIAFFFGCKPPFNMVHIFTGSLIYELLNLLMIAKVILVHLGTPNLPRNS